MNLKKIIMCLLITISINVFAQNKNVKGVNVTNYKIINEKINCRNDGIDITVDGRAVMYPYFTPTSSVVCNSPVVAFSGNGQHSNYGRQGVLTYTFSRAISCATVTYSYVEPNDVGAITTDGGGVVTLSNACGANINGNVLSSNLDRGVGNVTVRVSSTTPFTRITLTNVGNITGWGQGNPCNFILNDCNNTTPKPIGSDCNCWKPIGTKYNFLDLDNIGRSTIFSVNRNTSTNPNDRQMLDLPLYHVFPEYQRDSNGTLGVKFTFAMKPELKTYLENYLRYVNSTFKCVNMIRVSYSVNDVTGVFGLPNNTAVTPAFNLEMYIDNNGNITFNNSNHWNSYTFNGYYPTPKVREWDNQNTTSPLLPKIGKEYKTGISIVALSKGGTNEFDDTKKCGFDWKCSVLDAYFTWVSSASKKTSTTGYEVLDKDNKVIKVYSTDNQNVKINK